MLTAAIISSLILLILILVIARRALDYIDQHPEVMTGSAPLAYRRCHVTLSQIIARYKQIEGQITLRTATAWRSANGRLYTVSGEGIAEHRDASGQDVYHLRWEDISGVGVRMQPGFRITEIGNQPDSLYTTSYSFHLLVVPGNGATMDIVIPITGREDAVHFAAQIIALAVQQAKRVNLFGFEKAPAPYRQKISKV
jgi:hypothetical protein